MKFEIYKDKKGEWRWRVVARNGRVLMDCSEGYKSKKKMFKNACRFLDEAAYVADQAFFETYGDYTHGTWQP